MSLIFTKVGAIGILLGAQAVCSSWRKLCKKPDLFHSIDICDNNGEYYSTTNGHHKIMKLAKEAVNRSCGQLVDFSIDTFATDDLLELIIANNNPLRRLQFTCCCLYISDNAIIAMAKKLPLLEELEISYCDDFEYPEEVVETFGRFCPLLKSFTLKCWDRDKSSSILGDKEAFAIARSMPELLHLNLAGTCVTENGLRAILDSCPHISFLDLSWCTNLNFSWGLVKMHVDRNIKLRILNIGSIDKLITRMIRQLLSILKEYVKLIQEGRKLEAGYSGVDEFEAFYNKVQNLEADLVTGYYWIEDLETGYTTRLFAKSGSNEVLLNELTQMQSMLSGLLQEDVLLISEAVEVEQNVEAVNVQLHDLMLRISRMMTMICSFIPWLSSRTTLRGD